MHGLASGGGRLVWRSSNDGNVGRHWGRRHVRRHWLFRLLPDVRDGRPQTFQIGLAMKPVDPGLLEAACGGDSTAVETLLTSVRPDLKRFARRTCSTAEDAEDAVQITLWKLQRQLGSLRAVSALAGWLFRVVERECFRLFRAVRGNQDCDEGFEARLRAAPVPLDLRHDLARAIAGLPPLYRAVLVLRDIDEMSAPETAERLGISVAAVKIRLFRARGLMRTRLMEGSYWTGETPPE